MSVRQIHICQKVVVLLQRDAFVKKMIPDSQIAIGMVRLSDLNLCDWYLTGPMPLFLKGLNSDNFIGKSGSEEASPFLFGLRQNNNSNRNLLLPKGGIGS